MTPYINHCISCEEVRVSSARVLDSLKNLSTDSLSFFTELLGLYIAIDSFYQLNNIGYGADDVLEIFMQLFEKKGAELSNNGPGLQIMHRLSQLTIHINSFFHKTESKVFSNNKALSLLRSRGGLQDESENREYIYHLIRNLNPYLVYLSTALGMLETNSPSRVEQEIYDHSLLIFLTNSVYGVIGTRSKQQFYEKYFEIPHLQFVDDVLLFNVLVQNEVIMLPETPEKDPSLTEGLKVQNALNNFGLFKPASNTPTFSDNSEGRLLLQSLILHYCDKLTSDNWLTLTPLIQVGICSLTKNKVITTMTHQIHLENNQMIFLFGNNEQIGEAITEPEEQNKIVNNLILNLPEELLLLACVKLIMHKLQKNGKNGQLTEAFCQTADLQVQKKFDLSSTVIRLSQGGVCVRNQDIDIIMDKKGSIFVKNRHKNLSEQERTEIVRGFCSLFSYYSTALRRAEEFFANNLAETEKTKYVFNG